MQLPLPNIFLQLPDRIKTLAFPIENHPWLLLLQSRSQVVGRPDLLQCMFGKRERPAVIEFFRYTNFPFALLSHL